MADNANANFKARDIGMRAQKKLLSRMANKNIAKAFIDDTTGNLLDNLYRLAKVHGGNKKDAEKVIKNIIKVIIKIGILYRNNQFNQEELALADKFRKKFHSACMTVISFFEVDYSFDKQFLMQILNENASMLKQLVKCHLTEKSLSRIDHVFNFFGNPMFLEKAFQRNGEHKELLANLIRDMHKLMENGELWKTWNLRWLFLNWA